MNSMILVRSTQHTNINPLLLTFAFVLTYCLRFHASPLPCTPYGRRCSCPCGQWKVVGWNNTNTLIRKRSKLMKQQLTGNVLHPNEIVGLRVEMLHSKFGTEEHTSELKFNRIPLRLPCSPARLTIDDCKDGDIFVYRNGAPMISTFDASPLVVNYVGLGTFQSRTMDFFYNCDKERTEAPMDVPATDGPDNVPLATPVSRAAVISTTLPIAQLSQWTLVTSLAIVSIPNFRLLIFTPTNLRLS